MNSKSLRRLAGDHAALHNNPLPPNYLFGPSASNDSDLTSLDILLAGPTSTPYELGVFKLHLTIPTTYPVEPPKAFFRTKIFHPNVDDTTGAVCVETLKRDWDPKLSLRDVLVTISCLLVQPNASSALNADAGMLLEQGGDGWEAFAKRARMMTRLHAGVSRELKEAVRAAQGQGRESEELDPKDSGTEVEVTAASTRRRRGPPLQREMVETPVEVSRRTDAPSPPRPTRAAPALPFVMPSAQDDMFGGIRLPAPSISRAPQEPDSDSELVYADQENDASISPFMDHSAIFPSPRRQVPAVPLGELSMSEEDSLEEEYPPSPKKSPKKQQPRYPSFDYPPSPRKSPQKRLDVLPQARPELSRAESSRNGAGADRRLFFTPVLQNHTQQQRQTPTIDSNLDSSALDTNVTFDLGMETEPDTEVDVSFELPKRRPAAVRRLASNARTAQRTTRQTARTLDDPFNMSIPVPRLSRSRKVSPSTRKPVPPQTMTPIIQRLLTPPSSMPEVQASVRQAEVTKDKVRKSPAQVKNQKLEAKLWRLCGGDIEKWNRGDFGGHFEVKASRW